MRAYRRPLGQPLLSFLALIFSSLAGPIGCECWYETCFPSVPPLPTAFDTPTVVDIVPGEVHAAPLHHFLLEAIPRRADGTPVAGISVTWSPPTSGPITLTPDLGGGPFAQVVVRADAASGTTASVTATVTVDGVPITSQPAEITVSPPPVLFGGTVTGDRLEVGDYFTLLTGKPVPPAEAVIFDTQAELGPSSTECRWDIVLAMAGVVDFAENLIPGCESSQAPSPQPSTGGPEIAVFSGRGSPIVEDSAMLLPLASPRVTASSGDVLSWSQLDDPRPIHLHLWEGVDGDLGPTILDDVKYAAEALRLSRMGVVLEYGPVRELVRLPGSTEVQFDIDKWYLNDYLNEYIEPDVVPGEQVIHVLYVEKILNTLGGSFGEFRWNPLHNDAGYGLILVEKEAPWSTLLHELGHFLGHNYHNYVDDPYSDGSGHTNGIEGFDCTNAMWVGETLTCPGIRNRFTLGQAFRSWTDPGLNWIPHVGSLPLTRDCPSVELGSMGECPGLSIDVPGTEGET